MPSQNGSDKPSILRLLIGLAPWAIVAMTIFSNIWSASRVQTKLDTSLETLQKRFDKLEQSVEGIKDSLVAHDHRIFRLEIKHNIDPRSRTGLSQ